MTTECTSVYKKEVGDSTKLDVVDFSMGRPIKTRLFAFLACSGAFYLPSSGQSTSQEAPGESTFL